MADLSKPWESWNDVVKGRELFFKYLPLMESAYSATNPVAIKAMAKLMGLPSGAPRPPLPNIEGDKLKPLEDVIQRFRLGEKYGLDIKPVIKKQGKDFPDVLTQTVCDVKKNT